MASQANPPWAAVLRSHPALLSPPADPRENFASTDPATLLSDGRLTQFQYEALVTGRSRELILGNYILTDQIGEGGMGFVYKARHAKLGRDVAVKVLRPEKLKTANAARRFVREVRASAKLDHPLIVRALDADTADKRHFLVMEYVDGDDLAREVSTRGLLSAAAACGVAFQVALALQHLTENGLVHRDLKPTNLIRDRKTGAVKLLDLGLSKVLEDAPGGFDSGNLTLQGAIVGTPEYMSPEQAQDVRRVDIRTDLYALGCTLFHLLVGRPPYEGESPIHVLLKHAQEPVPNVNAARPDLPYEVAGMVERLMAKHPADRFQSPAELIAFLTALGATTDTGGTGGYLPMASPVNGHPSSPATTQVVSVGQDTSAWKVQLAEILARDSTQSGYHATPEAAPPSKMRDYRSTLYAVVGLLAAALLLTAAVLPWGRWLADPPPAPVVPPDESAFRPLKDRVQKYLDNPDPAAVAPLRADLYAAYAKQIGTPDAGLIVGLLKRLPSPLDRLPVPPAPDQPSVLVPDARPRHDGEIASIAVSADGNTLVTGGIDRTVRTWDAHTLLPKFTYEKHATPIFQVAVSADGGRIAATSGFRNLPGEDGVAMERSLIVWDAGKPEPIFSLTETANGGGWCLSSAFTTDGKRILAGQFGRSSLWEIAPRKREFAFEEPGQNWTPTVAVMPDGKVGITGGSIDNPANPPHDQLMVWNLETGKLIHKLPGHRGPVIGLAINPDNKHFASITTGPIVRVWDWAKGKTIHELTVEGKPSAVAWTPNGKELVVGFESGAIRFYSTDKWKLLRIARGHVGRVTGLATGHAHVFSSGADGTVRKWDPDSAAERDPGRLGSYPIRVGFASQDSVVTVVPHGGVPRAVDPLAKGPPPPRPDAVDSPFGLGLAPDGATALTMIGGRVAIWDVLAGKVSDRAVKWADPSDAAPLVVGPECKRAAFATDGGEPLRWIDTASGTFGKLIDPPKAVDAIAMGPEGKLAAAIGAGSQVALWDVASGQQIRSEKFAEVQLRALAIGATGKRVVAVGESYASAEEPKKIAGAIRLLPISTARSAEALDLGQESFTCVALSSDEELIAAGTASGTVILSTAKGDKRVFKAPSAATSVAFSIDGRALVVGLRSGGIAVFKISG